MDCGNKLYSSHRFILPEFRRRLLKTTENDLVKPHLDEEAQAKIEQQIKTYFANGVVVRVMVYMGYGIEEKVGLILAVSIADREIKLETSAGKVWLKLDDLVGLSRF